MKSTGYPLGALFVLVTVSAVLVAGIAPLVRLVAKGDVVNPGQLVMGVLAGVNSGCLIGAALGLLQFRKLLGAALGATAGTLIGAAAGGLAMLPASQLITAAIPMTAGCGLIVGVALLMRRTA